MAATDLLIPSAPVQRRTESKLDLVLGAYGNQLRTAVLFQPGQYPSQSSDKRDLPTDARDNVALYAGKPVVAKIQLEYDPYEVEQLNQQTGKYEKAKINRASITLDTVLIDVTLTKNIVTTQLNGRNGTVKEYIADDDFKVTLRGALVNAKGTAYPEAQVKQLMKILKAPVTLTVTSDYLTLYGIYSLVVTDYNLPQREGYTNTQLFDISCLSDNPVELVKLN